MPNHGVSGETMSRTVFTVAVTFGDVASGAGAIVDGAAVELGPVPLGALTPDCPRVAGAPISDGASTGGRIASRNGLQDASAGINSRAPSATNHTRCREMAEPRSIARVTPRAASRTSVAFARIMSTERPADVVSAENPEKRAGIGLTSR